MKKFFSLCAALTFIASCYVLIAGILHIVFDWNFMLRVGRGTTPVTLPEDTTGLIVVFIGLLIFFFLFWGLAKWDIVKTYIRKHPWAGVLPVLVIGGCITGIILFSENEANSNIFLAIQDNRIEAVEKLITTGTDVNMRGDDENKSTPLMSAVTWGTPEMVELLLRKGANPNLTDTYNHTPLMMAILFRTEDEINVVKIVRALLAAGADKTIASTDGKTVYEMAVDNRYPEVAELLK